MKALTIGIGGAAAPLMVALALAAPADAQSEAVVPPENSAASQYTEAIPTVGGNKPGGGKSGHRSPAKVLGTHKAQRLESHGKAGREVAEVVAATAPSSTPPVEQAPAAQAEAEPKPSQSAEGTGSGTPAAGSQRQGKGAGGNAGAESAGRSEGGRRTEIPGGSSGPLEVIGQATGSSSSGDLGPLLPLAIVGGIVWAAAYFRRQRRQLG